MLGAAVTSTPPKQGSTPFGKGRPSAKTVAPGAEQVLDGRLHVHAHVAPASPGDANPVNAGVGRKAAPQLGGSGAGEPLPSKSSNGPSHPSGATATHAQAPDAAAPPSPSRIGTASSNPQILEHPTAATQSMPVSAVRMKLRTGSSIGSGILSRAAHGAELAVRAAGNADA